MSSWSFRKLTKSPETFLRSVLFHNVSLHFISLVIAAMNFGALKKQFPDAKISHIKDGNSNMWLHETKRRENLQKPYRTQRPYVLQGCALVIVS